MLVRTRRADQTKDLVSSVALGLYRALVLTDNGTKKMSSRKKRMIADKKASWWSYSYETIFTRSPVKTRGRVRCPYHLTLYFDEGA